MDWLSRRQRDGGLDPVRLPAGVAGRLWLCGKHAIGPDPGVVLSEVGGVATVVCLTERHELLDRYPAYVEWLDDPCSPIVWLPIPDLHAPSLEQMTTLIEVLRCRVVEGDTLVVHCAAGKGRAGTTAVCLLVALGMRLEDALARVATSRPGAGPEVGAQRDLVTAFADAWHDRS